MSIKIRVAPSIGELERTFEEAWGLETYNPKRDKNEPMVFAGLYGLSDFYALWKHRGKKYVWWAGSDIRHFKEGYWLDDTGKIKLNCLSLAKWINKNCEVWVENEIEKEMLLPLIKSKICPSFLGNIKDYEISYQWKERPQVYSSVSGDNFKLYCWDEVEKLARKYQDIDFHLYGNRKEWKTKNKNVFVHGWVPKEQMNEQIKHMQGALRLLPLEGFSEIVAKSILWGQWPISVIPYMFMLLPEHLKLLKKFDKPNILGRNYYIKKLNQYPWIK